MAYMASLRARIQAGLGCEAVITGWSYRLLPEAADGTAQVTVRAAAGGIGDAGNMRVLMVVDARHLDPVADADALNELRRAPEGARLACEVAYQVRERWWRRWGW
jgi:Na+-transporting NADH:ubiquinone oxidoreductase subunit NqrF